MMKTNSCLASLVLMIVACVCGCSEKRQPKVLSPGMVPISFVSDQEYLAEARKCGMEKLGEHGTVETWTKLHDALIAVAEKHGSAGWSIDPVPDFYHTGDWFDQYCDSFSLHSTNGLSSEALREFQKVVAAHHPRASLELYGQIDSIEGLEILISSMGIFVKWNGQSAPQCQRKLERLKIHLE